MTIPRILAQPSDAEIMALIGSFFVVIVLVISAYYWHGTRTQRRMFRLFGRRYRDLPVVSQSFPIIDLPNVRRAVEAYAAESACQLEVHTVASRGLQGRLDSAGAKYYSVDIDHDARESCVINPLYVFVDGDRSATVLVLLDGGDLTLEALAATEENSARVLERLRQLIRKHNVYRGKVISIETDPHRVNEPTFLFVRFHRLPQVDGAAIVLPAATRKVIDRNTVGFFRHAARLRAHGQPVKRGLLFHGPPGTGKTRTACWLAHSLPDVTVLLVTGEQLWNIKECCRLARVLAPAMLILEDVDLIAIQREQNVQTTALHQLMNEMDGLDADAEVLFLLTTNRPESIEPALVNRPGRIDQAIHFPLPDVDCRRRLVELYAGAARLDIRDWPRLLDRTDGASPAFIKELMRKATMIAIERAGCSSESTATSDASAPVTLSDSDLHEALDEMTAGENNLTQRLVGFMTGS